MQMSAEVAVGDIAMRTFLTKLFQQRAGATAIEYGLIAALIGVLYQVALIATR
jgi:Flp pilus assembly pilin Flp